MKLIFVRHGEADGNEKHIVMGWRPGKLTKKGVMQAKKKAQILKSCNVDAIYTSDLRRAVQTTNEIARFHNVPVNRTKALREAHVGSLEGRTITEKLDATLDDDYCNLKLRKYHAEPVSHLYKRVKDLVLAVYKHHKDGTVLFVSHSITFRLLVAAIRGKPPSYSRKVGYIDNDEIAVFSVTLKGRKFNARLLRSESLLHKRS